MRKITDVMFALLRAELCGEKLSEEVRQAIDTQVLRCLYELSRHHDLAHLIGDTLHREGLLGEDETLRNDFLMQRRTAVYRYEQMRYELKELCRVLEEAGIEHIPLKGANLRQYYPDAWMRTSCDIDILVKKADLERAVALLGEKLSYEYENQNSHDVQLWAPSGVHLELHFSLIEEYVNPASVAVLDRVWTESLPKAGKKYQKEISDELFYFYHVAHMAKHVLIGGCGCRAFLDLWILNHRKEFDGEKRAELLEQGNLTVFARTAEALSEVWLSGKEHTELTQKTEEYTLRGGIYGSNENKNLVLRGKMKGKFGYLMYRIFLPYDVLCYTYPRLQGRKWLYPFYTVKRWLNRLFKGRAAAAAREARAASALEEERIGNTKKLMKDLGLTD